MPKTRTPKTAKPSAKASHPKATKPGKSRAPATADFRDEEVTVIATPQVAEATDAAAPPSKLSGLDAAAQVLRDAGEPLDAQAIIARVLERGLWTTSGKTPAATIYSAIIREIKAKGSASRFQKVDRGRFAAAG